MHNCIFKLSPHPFRNAQFLGILNPLPSIINNDFSTAALENMHLLYITFISVVRHVILKK